MIYECKTAYSLDRCIMDEKDRIVCVLFYKHSEEVLIRQVEKLQVPLVQMVLFLQVNTQTVQEFNDIYGIDGRAVLMAFYNSRPVRFDQDAYKLYQVDGDFITTIKRLWVRVKKQDQERAAALRGPRRPIGAASNMAGISSNSHECVRKSTKAVNNHPSRMHVVFDTRDIKKHPSTGNPQHKGKSTGIPANATADDEVFEHKEINSNPGKALQRIRNEKGLSKKELAQKLSIPESNITKWENGQVQMPGPVKSRIESFLKTKLQ